MRFRPSLPANAASTTHMTEDCGRCLSRGELVCMWPRGGPAQAALNLNQQAGKSGIQNGTGGLSKNGGFIKVFTYPGDRIPFPPPVSLSLSVIPRLQAKWTRFRRICATEFAEMVVWLCSERASSPVQPTTLMADGWRPEPAAAAFCSAQTNRAGWSDLRPARHDERASLIGPGVRQ